MTPHPREGPSHDGSGAVLVAKALAAGGIESVHVVPGEETVDLVDALADEGIDLIVCRHEQHAAFMAAASGRLTGRPGTCLATLGPGATNLLTGLAHADLGGMPLVALTGQKPAVGNREGSFQVIDVPALARPVTKWATSVTDAQTLPATIGRALSEAAAGRPGPVLVEIPEDVAAADTCARIVPAPPAAPAPPPDEVLDACARAIDEATRPVVMTSAGAQHTDVPDALVALADATGIGVVATQMGKGVLSEDHPCSLRTLGIHEPDYAHLAVLPADLVVTVGYDPVEHPPLAWNPDGSRSILHVAGHPAVRELGFEPRLELVGDVAAALDGLATRIRRRDHEHTAVLRGVIDGCLQREVDALCSDPLTGRAPTPLDAVLTVRAELDDDDVIALDNGLYKIWFARHYPARRPHTVLLDNALATMGAGLATAMSACRHRPDRRVLAVCGDGGFMMNVQDLETAVRLGLQLTILVLSDDGYGFIRWHQQRQGAAEAAVSVGNPDLVALAGAFGASGHRVADAAELGPALRTALAETGVSLVTCSIDYSGSDLFDADLYALAEQALADADLD